MNFNLVSFLRRHAGIVCGFSAMFLAANTVAAKKTVNVLPVADYEAVESASVSVEDEDSVYLTADVMPEFPGGTEALMKYMSKNTLYPLLAFQHNIQGRVLVSFTVDKDGNIVNPEIAISAHPLLDASAINVIAYMPKWKPGKVNGKRVNVKYSIPVGFRIKQEDIEANLAKLNADKVQTASGENKETSADSTEQVHLIVESMPEFPGGMTAMLQYLSRNIKYPSFALDHGIQGRVSVSFTIDTDGSIIDPGISKGVHPSLDAEAIRVIWTMPKWNPGKQKGKPVKVKYTVPVAFRMQ